MSTLARASQLACGLTLVCLTCAGCSETIGDDPSAEAKPPRGTPTQTTARTATPRTKTFWCYQTGSEFVVWFARPVAILQPMVKVSPTPKSGVIFTAEQGEIQVSVSANEYEGEFEALQVTPRAIHFRATAEGVTRDILISQGSAANITSLEGTEDQTTAPGQSQGALRLDWQFSIRIPGIEIRDEITDCQ